MWSERALNGHIPCICLAPQVISAAHQAASGPQLDPPLAEQLVTAYQAARSAALRSPAQAERLLPRLMQGPALAANRQQAQVGGSDEPFMLSRG